MNTAARLLLVLATAALNLVPHRGLDFGMSLALHLAATAGWLWLVRGVVVGAYRPGFGEALGLAVLLRLLVLPLSPALSDDVYRYVYEGELVLAGGNPYTTPPEEAPVELRGEYWELINNPEIPAAYPPAVQYGLALGVLIHPSPFGMKVLFGALDLLVFVVLWRWLPLLGVGRERAVVYGFCPLMVLEFAGEGHNDSLAVLFMVLALWLFGSRRFGLAGGSLAVATAGKFLPGMLLPFLVRDSWSGSGVTGSGFTGASRALGAFVVVLGLLYLGFLAPVGEMFEGAENYARRWRGNESLFALIIEPLEWLEQEGSLAGREAQEVAKYPLVAMGLGLLAFAWWRRWALQKVGAAFFLFYVAWTPVLHPWYLGFLVPFLCVYVNWGWLAFAGSVFLAYHVLPRWLEEGVWEEQVWVKVVEYLPLYVGFLLVGHKQRSRSSPMRPRAEAS